VNMMQTQVGRGTVVYMILDGNTLTTMLFTGGEYYNNLSNRIYSVPGTAEFTTEIRNAVSSIQQFATAQHIEAPISDIFIAGLSAENMNIMKMGLQGYAMADVIRPISCPANVSMRTGQEKFGDFIFSFSGLFTTSDGFTLLEALKRSSAKYVSRKNTIKLVIPYVVTVILLTVVSVIILVIMIEKKAELAELQVYNGSQIVIDSVTEYDRLVGEATIMGNAQGGAELLEKYIDSYPIPDSSVNEAISNAAGKESVTVTFDSYSAVSGVLQLTARAGDVKRIHKFIASLMAMDLFEAVDYTGYSNNEDDGTWSINVVCTLAEGE
nr:hypothetical protein [Lachnospiraceae bacterium]